MSLEVLIKELKASFELSTYAKWMKAEGLPDFDDYGLEDVVGMDWKEGSVYSPLDGWYNQHFNTGSQPARPDAEFRWPSEVLS